MFVDQNGNGIFDSGIECGADGITVFLDQNGNGDCDGNELASITDAAGRYGFFNLEPDHFELRLVMQNGWLTTLPAANHGGYSINPEAGENLADMDFGFQLANTPDFNSNGLVDDEDLSIWQAGFGITENGLREQGDADSDGDIDGIDFLLWQQGYGTDAAAGTQTSGLPIAATASKPTIPFDLALSEPDGTTPATKRYGTELFKPDPLAKSSREGDPSIIEDQPHDQAIHEVLQDYLLRWLKKQNKDS